MNEAELRKRFEAWAGGQRWLQRIPVNATTVRAGEYYSEATQFAWMAWCEASRQNKTERASSDGNSAEVSGVGDCGDHGPQAFRRAGD